MPQETDATITTPSSEGQTQLETSASSAESSPADKNAESGAKTLAEVVTSAAEASQAATSDSKGSDAPASDGKETAKSDVKEDPAAEPQSQDNDDPDKALPFAEHPRWKEVYGKMKDTEREVETLRSQENETKPFVEAQRATNEFCQQNRITVQQYRDMLDIQALINNDPKAAFAKLEPLYNRLAALNGKAPETSFDPDIRQAIESGKIDAEWAQRMQAERAQRSFVQERSKMTENEQASFIQKANEDAVSQWARDMAQKDTSFKPSANGARGVFELTTYVLGDLCRRTPPRNPLEAAKLAQNAYEEARKIIAPTRTPVKATGGKALPANGSSMKSRVEPKTLSDVVFGIAEGTLKSND